MEFQKTINSEICLTGIGLHSGEEVHLRIAPAAAGHGICFRRTDLPHAQDIRAQAGNVVDTMLATVLGRGEATVSTVEHLMAALYAMGVDNAIVHVDGPELPIMDGSARVYVDAIRRTGLRAQKLPKRIIKIEKPIRIEDGDKFSILRPFHNFRITYSIDFPNAPGEKHFMTDVNAETFAEQLSMARTFGFMAEVEMLKKMGKARGATLENAVALHDGKVLNPDGLRMPDELVRHKMLDAVGDFALIGAGLMGHLIVHKGGHELHRRLAVALLERTDAWSLVTPEKVRETRPRTYAAFTAAAMAHA